MIYTAYAVIRARQFDSGNRKCKNIFFAKAKKMGVQSALLGKVCSLD